jgi:hypothetical protein
LRVASEIVLAVAVLAVAIVIFGTLAGSIRSPFRPPLWWWLHTLNRRGNFATAMAATATLLLGAAIVAVLYAFVADRSIGVLRLDERCQKTPLGCNVVTEVFVTIFVALVALTWFFVWRRRRIAGHYRKRARQDPARLFRAPSEIEHAAVREDLLKSIAEDICRPRHRRPQVVLGGIGAGKTTTAVQLTKWLADRGAVPIPLELGDVDDDLDLFDLAKEKFVENVEDKLLSEDQGDRVWRKLCADGSIVVIGDALDASLSSLHGDDPQWREQVRYAVETAQARVPLVITTRARRGLEGLDIAVVPIDPLGEHEAFELVRQRSDQVLDEEAIRELRDLIGSAQLAETPFFLNVAGDLHAIGKLLPPPSGSGRSALRVDLLDRWIHEVAEGRLIRDADLVASERRRAIDQLEAVAFHALRHNLQKVDVGEVEPEEYDTRERNVSKGWDPDHVAAAAVQLGLAEHVGPGRIEFRHSIVAAYLASRRLVPLLKTKGEDFVQPLAARVTREGFMAMTMSVARSETTDLDARRVIDLEMEMAETARDDAKLWFATAAADVVQAAGPGVVSDEEVRRIAIAARESVGQTSEWLPKIRVVPRLAFLGEADAYDALWILCQDDDYAVRLSAAITLAEGGSEAYERFRGTIVGTAAQAVHGAPNGYTPREIALQGWIMPTLEATVGQGFAGEAEEIVDAWAAMVGDGLDPATEASLAKGFKLEATRVVGDEASAVRARRWSTLQELLHDACFWYSRVMLLQAICLRAVADGELDSQARAILKDAANNEPHPLARATAVRCLKALAECDRTREPQDRDSSRYVWFDETALVGAAGASYWANFASGAGSQVLRIPTATNWRLLASPAAQIVADAVLLLNLLEKGDEPQRAQTLARMCEPDMQDKLPHCLLEEPGRSALSVTGDGVSRNPSPCPAECGMKLCPYPTRAEGPYRGEISEPFCRQQRHALYAPFSKAPWHAAPRRHLRDFWHQMERRASL